MFEQASLDTRGVLRSPWAITVSFAGQSLALTTGILISLIHTDALPRVLSIATITTPGRTLKPASPPPGVRAIVERAPAFTPRLVFPLDNRKSPVEAAASRDWLLSAGEPQPGAIGEGMGDLGGPGLLGIPSPLATQVAPPPPPPAQTAPRTEKPAPSKPLIVSLGVQAAKLTRQVKPVYPPLAVQARISGTVRLAAVIGRDGSIQNLQVVSGHPLLTPAALDAVRQWPTWRPCLTGSRWRSLPRSM
jgi:protein TonB